MLALKFLRVVSVCKRFIAKTTERVLMRFGVSFSDWKFLSEFNISPYRSSHENELVSLNAGDSGRFV